MFINAIKEIWIRLRELYVNNNFKLTYLVLIYVNLK